MRAGRIVGQRFEIEHLAGVGGMGRVYRARDVHGGETVALKVVQEAGDQELARFEREARALAAMQVPGVVRYVAHGTTGDEQPYLAMEWLEGETLSERLSRGQLTLEESLDLAGRVALTLGRIHRMGVVHRDLKPSNLLLVDGEIRRVTLIDFGVARLVDLEHQLTKPGSVVGTLGYMAPEQARGQLDIDARADVFALGCVLFKCLTGRAVFDGANGLAVLAKVLLEEPPRLRTLLSGVSARLDHLVARMLAKPREQRPPDGDAVAAALAALQERTSRDGVEPPASSARAQELTSDERRVMCLVLAFSGAHAVETSAGSGSTQRTNALYDIAQRHQGLLELLDGRLPLIVLSGVGAPTDLAARAAHCALALERKLGSPPIAVVTGRAEIASQLPVGDLIDRAARMRPPRRESGRAAQVRLDEVTAALLGSRFEIVHDECGAWLEGARDEPEAQPQLLGKPMPCVGRDRELAHLAAELSHAIEEPAATAVVVTGPAGMGKSRLRREFLQMLRVRHETAEVWFGQADVMSAGSAFSLLADALRKGLGIVDGEPIEERRRKVWARVERHEHLDTPRVAVFLGELVGALFPDDDDIQLRAARQNPMLMGDQLRRAWEELLEAECSVRPIVLVLEDLHWGDLPTVMLVDAALRQLKQLPFLVLALARPDVHQAFPKLWEGRGCQELRLTPLSARAGARLVREALGKGASPKLVDTLVQRANGNAFYLEELIRAAASGKSDALPETVLAMVQMELESLAQEARRILRAASIFGESFSQSGVAALLGGAEVAEPLLDLAQREVIQRVGANASGEIEYRFRHALVREAAYGMLTDRDRQLGHALAGAFLDRAGNAEPMALAEHFERGADPARAATAYLRAAEHAMRGNDFAAAIEYGNRGLAGNAEPEIDGALRLVQADAHNWRGEYPLGEQRALEAAARLGPGTAGWFTAITHLVTAAGRLGAYDRVETWMATARDAAPQPGAEVAKHICLASGATQLMFSGRSATADALIEVVERATLDAATRDITVVARLERARAIRAQTHGNTAAALLYQQANLVALEQVGDHRNAHAARTNIAYLSGQLGDYQAAEEALRNALTAAERIELHSVTAAALHNLGLVLAYRGQLEEARAAEQAALETVQRLGEPRMEGGTRYYLAMILLLAGDAEAAEREARTGIEILHNVPPALADAHAVHARALLDLGRTDEALPAARRAVSLLASFGSEEGDSRIRLVYAEVLAASGLKDEAARAISRAREILLARAEKIGDPVWRERFLRNVPDNARTLDLAERWLGTSPPD